MKVSIIWIWSEDMSKNQKTVSYLQKEFTEGNTSAQILVYTLSPDVKAELPDLGGKVKIEIMNDYFQTEAEAYADAKNRITGDVVTQLYSGDVWSIGTVKELEKQISAHSQYDVFMLCKIMPDGSVGAFANETSSKATRVEKLAERFSCYPFYFGGTFVKSKLYRKHDFQLQYGEEAEREFFLSLCAEEKFVLYIKKYCYFSSEEREGELEFFKRIFDKRYYFESFTEFWIPYLQELKEKYGAIPKFIQYHLMFSIRCRLAANWNNKNKHVIDENEAVDCLKLIGNVLQLIDEDVIYNSVKLVECDVPDSEKWIFGILKYGKDYHFRKVYLAGMPYYAGKDTIFNMIQNLKTNIQFMNYENGKLEIDGEVHPILRSMADEVFFTFNGKKYLLDYNDRYALTKVFGVSIYKKHAFHVTLPLDKMPNSMLFCFCKFGDESIKIQFTYDSHFSRMSGLYENSYWHFGNDPYYICTKAEDGLKFAKVGENDWKKQEKLLQKEMFGTHKKRDWLFIAIRKAYFAAKPFMKKKPIWMYLDKIYKGGDSSEYLYKYSVAQNDGIQHYYLIDKNASDYVRLKKEGYKPLVRGSIRHRLVFLLADMMVISNSTVFAFNDFPMANSCYIRDLPDFHVCCVQHGMSVQKIAVAQNRLRDNTRLYFCASKYEIYNLMRPVYDYRGYNALKLTGVPRYDGLVNNDKKQILISPTWRMQSAVQVRTNEGRQREYNPLFKESMYFKVFNALINNKRLIDAAQKYGYKIKYVLHPIVSSQAKDFDKNEYVDIIPAVGDMSYEKLFCESSLMVTDFSGIQFDFAYMRKPLVYLHHKDIPQHYEEGTFFYDTMAFGEICHDNEELIDVLCEYMENGCQMKTEYVKRADDFFHYNDHNNCERIYNVMREYQDKYIFHNGEVKKEYSLSEKYGVVDFEKREEDQQPFRVVLKEEGISLSNNLTTDYYYSQKIKDNVVVLVGLGKNVRGSMQYVLNELNRLDRYEDFEVYVRTDEDTAPIVQEYIDKNHWYKTYTVTEDKKYSKILATAKYLITETFFPYSWVKKPGQVYVNIWHGTPLKKLGLAKNSTNVHKDGNTQKNFINADYVLYPNQYTKEHMLASYKVSELMNAKVLMLGYPRTGGMMQAAEEDLSDLKKLLAPNGERIYAYMPTWKDYLEVEEVVAESKELLDYLDSHFEEDQILYVNLHHKVSDSLDYSEFKHIRKFPPNVDNYRLLAATDALITDYSSVFYDYLALRKQIVLYCADYELYREKRGTYMDLMELPFDKARTKEAVLDALNRGKTYDDTEAFNAFCKYDSTLNAEKLCDAWISGKEDQVVQEEIEHSDRRKVMIFTEACQNSVETDSIRRAVEDCNQNEIQIYIGCERQSVDRNKDSAYPMLWNVPVIGVPRKQHLSSVGKGVLDLYQQNKMDLQKAMQYLKYDYTLSSFRMFGRARFDMVVIYDVVDPQLILSLAMMESTKILHISSSMIAKMKEGDQFLIDALKYTLPYVSGVFAGNIENKAIAEDFLGIHNQIQILDNVEDFENLLTGKRS